MIDLPALLNIPFFNKGDKNINETNKLKKEKSLSQENINEIRKNSLSSSSSISEEESTPSTNKNHGDSSDENMEKIPSVKVKLSTNSDENENEEKEKIKTLLSMRKAYASTGNIKLREDNNISPFNPILRRSRNFEDKDFLIRSALEKNSLYYSMNGLKRRDGLNQSRIRHSNSSSNFPGIEGNTRSIDDIKKFRSHMFSDSNISLYSDYNSTDSISSSVMSFGSSYSICDSCDTICESIIDLLEKKETRRFTEMENGHLKLITFNQCPKWLTDNPYIISNYRPPCYSYKACYQSLLYIHNETVNIIFFSFFFFLFFS